MNHIESLKMDYDAIQQKSIEIDRKTRAYIKKLREEKGYTHMVMASKIGKNKAWHYQRLERGENKGGIRMIDFCKIAFALGHTPASIILNAEDEV